MAKGICSGCQETFNSESIHTFHRYGSYGDPVYNQKGQITGYTPSERQCLTDVQMYTKGWTKNDKGWWVTSLYDASAHAEKEPVEVTS